MKQQHLNKQAEHCKAPSLNSQYEAEVSVWLAERIMGNRHDADVAQLKGQQRLQEIAWTELASVQVYD